MTTVRCVMKTGTKIKKAGYTWEAREVAVKEAALKYFHSTIHIYRNNIGEKHPDLSNCYNNLGEFYLKENKLDSALITE